VIDPAERDFKKRNRRSFLVAGAAALGGLAGLRWLTTRRSEDDLLWPLHSALGLNEEIWRDLYKKTRLAPEFAKSQAVAEARENGDIGIAEEVEPSEWKLLVEGTGDEALATDGLTLADIKSLPRVEMITELKCIEGWSQIVQWAGARFSDFVSKYSPGAMTEYVSMETPDGEYYVGLDMDSAIHPQTLLAYEMNGAPLTSAHGAPLRLVIPLKYGIKNIKRIGTIRFTNRRPTDYWAERGYDWYAGH
jgi:DMSO/TMAO reductase YedYZ molybdopterin-dependent catalytic subunit